MGSIDLIKHLFPIKTISLMNLSTIKGLCMRRESNPWPLDEKQDAQHCAMPLPLLDY